MLLLTFAACDESADQEASVTPTATVENQTSKPAFGDGNAIKGGTDGTKQKGCGVAQRTVP